MKISAIIVDDEAPARRRIKKLLGGISDCDLISEAESGAQAIEVIDQLKPALVFLDIQLKDMTGFDVLKSLKHRELNIIFTTAYDSFAIRAFEENAIDYLLKPFKDSRFYEAFDRVKERQGTNHEKSISNLIQSISTVSQHQKIHIPEGKTTHLIDVNQVEFIQSNAYYCDFHKEDQSTKMIRISLKSLETILPENFVRISKSLIVNKHKILSIRHLKSTIEIELPGNRKFSVTNKKEIAERLI